MAEKYTQKSIEELSKHIEKGKKLLGHTLPQTPYIHKSENRYFKKILAGKRAYFLEVKTSKYAQKYLSITGSKLNTDQEYEHQTIVIFQEYFLNFFESLVKLAPELGLTQLEDQQSMLEMSFQYPKAYQYWTKEEDENLEKHFCDGKSMYELSSVFQRQPGAIYDRIEKLGLREKYCNRL